MNKWLSLIVFEGQKNRAVVVKGLKGMAAEITSWWIGSNTSASIHL